MSFGLQYFDDAAFLSRAELGKDADLIDPLRQVFVRYLLQLIAQENIIYGNADVTADLLRNNFVIACKNLELDAQFMERLDGRFGRWFRGIEKPDKSGYDHIAFIGDRIVERPFI